MKAEGEALGNLETQLRDRAETLGLSLEQKTKDMKQREKKVTYIMEQTHTHSLAFVIELCWFQGSSLVQSQSIDSNYIKVLLVMFSKQGSNFSSGPHLFGLDALLKMALPVGHSLGALLSAPVPSHKIRWQ